MFTNGMEISAMQREMAAIKKLSNHENIVHFMEINEREVRITIYNVKVVIFKCLNFPECVNHIIEIQYIELLIKNTSEYRAPHYKGRWFILLNFPYLKYIHFYCIETIIVID